MSDDNKKVSRRLLAIREDPGEGIIRAFFLPEPDSPRDDWVEVGRLSLRLARMHAGVFDEWIKFWRSTLCIAVETTDLNVTASVPESE